MPVVVTQHSDVIALVASDRLNCEGRKIPLNRRTVHFRSQLVSRSGVLSQAARARCWVINTLLSLSVHTLIKQLRAELHGYVVAGLPQQFDARREAVGVVEILTVRYVFSESFAVVAQ